MQKYLVSYKQMISLRGLTDHTIQSYSTYLNVYLDYLANTLHKLPEDVFLHTWGQQLNYHPHIHCIVAGAGLTKAKQFKRSSKKLH